MGSLKVFVSYSHADKIVARRVARRLIAHGIKTWFDERELRIGAVLTSTLRTYIENADVVLVIASQNSVESDWVEMELSFAKEHGKIIIPIFIEMLSKHERFKDSLGIDACSLQLFADALDNLVRKLYNSIELELPPANPDILISNLQELVKEEPDLAPLIFGYLESKGLHHENAEIVYGVTFHALDESLNSLFELYPRADMAYCAAYGFNKAGAGTRALTSWIRITNHGDLPIIAAVNTTLVTELIPTAIRLLSLCSIPNNQALYCFIEKNRESLDEEQCHSVIRLVTWPVRLDSSDLGDVLAWVALKHFPSSLAIQQMWMRWINNGIFDDKDKPRQLANYLSDANKEQLLGWERISEELRIHVRRSLRSKDKVKVYNAINHVIAAAEKSTPVFDLLLREAYGVSGTAEWDDWRKLDPDMAEFTECYLNYILEEARGEQNWLRAWENAQRMIGILKTTRESRKKQ